MFHSIRPVAPTLALASKHELAAGKTEAEGLVALDAGKWTRVQNSLCYSAVIGSYYRLGEFQLALQYYEEARKLGVFPRFREGMMVAEIHATSREFEAALGELRALRRGEAGEAEASGVSWAERWAPGAESSVESGCGRTKPSCRRCGARCGRCSGTGTTTDRSARSSTRRRTRSVGTAGK